MQIAGLWEGHRSAQRTEQEQLWVVPENAPFFFHSLRKMLCGYRAQALHLGPRHPHGWALWLVPLAALAYELTEHWEGLSQPQGIGLVSSGVWSLGPVPAGAI